MLIKNKKVLPPKARNYIDLVKHLYKSGYTPLSKAMKEAGRRWRIRKQAK